MVRYEFEIIEFEISKRRKSSIMEESYSSLSIETESEQDIKKKKKHAKKGTAPS